MNRMIAIVGLVATLLLGGCLPEKRVVWSPDGRWAAVKGADGLYLSDATGRLSPRLIEGLVQAAWMPDSRHLVVSRTYPAGGWDAAVRVLPAERVQAIEGRAPQLRAEILAHQGEWKDFKPQSFKDLTGGEVMALLVYVRDKLGQGLSEKLGAEWADYEKLDVPIAALQLALVRDDGTLEQGPVLAEAVDQFQELRISPTGTVVAYRGVLPDDDDAKPLFVVPMDASAAPRMVVERAALFPDWSADGRDLVYASTTASLPSGSKELRLGVVARQELCAADGTLLATFGKPEELAGIVYQNEVRVRCLRDGRVLFAALEVQLPCTTKDMPERAGLFAIDPGRQPGVVSLIPRQAVDELPDAMFLFEVSPDEQHVCIPGGDGRVAVLTLATGEVWPIVHEGEVDHLRTEPTWRSANELCFAVVPGPQADKERAAIALAQLDWVNHRVERSIISADWPEDVSNDFLQSQGQTKAPGAASQE